MLINNSIKESPILGLCGMGGGIALSPGPSGFTVKQSLRYSDSTASLDRTPSASGDRRTWTFATWVKRGKFDSTQGLFGCSSGASDAQTTEILFTSTERLMLQGNSTVFRQTDMRFRDPSAWYHIVVVCDIQNGTPNDRIRFYVNGNKITDWDSINNPSTGDVFGINQSDNHRIGRRPNNSDSLEGYLAETIFLDGIAVTDTNGVVDEFGEFNSDGVWVPREYTGPFNDTSDVNGFRLTYDSSQTNDIGTDSSGNNNNWTDSNFVASDEDLLDAPTSNFPLFNPKVRNGGTYAEAHMEYVTPTADSVTPTTFSFNTSNSESWYVEFTHNLANRSALGVANAQATNYSSSDARGITTPCVVYDSNGPIWINGSEQSPSQSVWNVGSTISMRFDASTRNIIFANNGTDQTGVTATLPADSDMTIICGDLTGAAGGGIFNINCGQQSFNQSVPAGFVAPQSNNLGVASSIRDGSQHCGVVTYTGTGVDSHAIPGLNFQPDLVWIKPRSVTDNHRLIDAVRGVSTHLVPNSIDDEPATNAQILESFDSGGFTLNGTDAGWNGNTSTYVAWCWKANGSGSANTDGNMTVTTSANTTNQFSICTYNATGVAGSFGHGLGQTPEFMMIKSLHRDASWVVWHKDLANDQVLHLNSDDAEQDHPNAFQATEADSEVVYLGNGSTADTNQTNATNPSHAAYIWSSVPGYSKFGTFTGDDQSDGPYIYTGFRPRIILMKSATNGFDWFIWDTERNKFNPSDNTLEPNQTTTEADASSPVQSIDIYSNGFKILGGNQVNQPNARIIYAAWGDNPLGGPGVKPITAR